MVAAVTGTEAEIAALTRADYDARKPIIQQQEADLLAASTDTSLVDSAMERSSQIAERGGARQQRRLRGYGVELSGAQALANQQNLNMAEATGATQQIADARLSQQENQLQALGELVSLGRQRQMFALKGLGDYSNQLASSQRAYNNAHQQYRNQRSGVIGAVGRGLGFALGI